MWIKPTLAELVADFIRSQIESGEFVHRLPGESALTEMTGVSRGSVRAALVLLEREGMVVTTQGKNRRIVAPARREADVLPRISMLMPRDRYQMGAPLNQIIAEVRRILEGQAVLNIQVSRAVKMKRPSRHLQRLVDTHRSSLWILLQSSTATQQWFAGSGTPCLVFGTGAEDVGLPAMDTDWRATGLHLARLIERHGHQRVLLLERHIQTRGTYDLKSAYSEGFEQAGIFYEGVYPEYGVIPVFEKKLSRSGGARPNPSVVIFYEYEDLITGVTWLQAKGWRIPEDIAVICLDGGGSIGNIYPLIAHYRRSVSKLSKGLVSLILTSLENHPMPARREYLQDYIPGDSFGGLSEE